MLPSSSKPTDDYSDQRCMSRAKVEYQTNATGYVKKQQPQRGPLSA
jgi:hypothetical protein